MIIRIIGDKLVQYPTGSDLRVTHREEGVIPNCRTSEDVGYYVSFSNLAAMCKEEEIPSSVRAARFTADRLVLNATNS